MRRDVGLVGLTFASLGSIIGSGWLFGALFAAQAAGPAALVSWGLGGLAVILLALIHAELGSMYPVAGGSARFPHFSHGSIVGFAIGWIAWIGAVTTAPIEVEAALQYATHYAGWLTWQSGDTTVLTVYGYGVAAVLMLVFTRDQPDGRPLADRDQQVHGLVEARDPDRHRRRADGLALRHRQPDGGRRASCRSAGRACSSRSRPAG